MDLHNFTDSALLSENDLNDLKFALLGHIDIDLLSKYAVMGCVHDMNCPTKPPLFPNHQKGVMSQIWSTILAAIIEDEAAVKAVLQRWYQEVSSDFQGKNNAADTSA